MVTMRRLRLLCVAMVTIHDAAIVTSVVRCYGKMINIQSLLYQRDRIYCATKKMLSKFKLWVTFSNQASKF